ncbi:MAG: HXXEE domain-containing protein [Desulfatitalea sp.]|nr:HXXEE domain-containing protein [Desulfatitalea sp.]NNK01600.1 HXXEE domain-containing protein [Desulfatitalea sp.]
MTNILVKRSMHLLAALGVIVAAYTAINWADLPVLQRLACLIFITLAMHGLEEYLFPGGFMQLVMRNMNVAFTNAEASKFAVVYAIVYLSFVPLFFTHVAWMVMAPMLLGIVEFIMHLFMIKLFKVGRPYTPGLASATCMLPISIYAIVHVVQNNLMQPVQWLFTLLFMATCLWSASIILAKVNGMKYFDLIKTYRAGMLAKLKQM